VAKDFPGSLSYYEAKVLERSHAKRRIGAKDSAIIDQNQTDCCWTYYVHYQGLNSTDQWVNEDDILDTEVPLPKFDIDQKVLARDLPRCSLLYEAKVLL